MTTFLMVSQNRGERTVLYGYRPWEVGLTVNVPEVDASFKLFDLPVTQPLEDKVMAVSLGCHLEGASNFFPHTHDPDAAKLATMKRIATRMPDPDKELFEEFFDHCIDLMKNEMSACILRPDTDVSVAKWLEGTPYAAYRKVELQETADSHSGMKTKDRHVSSHIKYETYQEPKYPRGIFSRSDFFKTFFGPACALVGKKFFKLKWFIKKYDSMGKINRMKEIFDSPYVKIFTNDFTAYESTMRRHFMVIEIMFFAMCFQFLPEFEQLMEEIMIFKLGVNTLVFRWFIVRLMAKRYSGEMDTSLSNGLINFFLITFMLRKSGHSYDFYTKFYPPQLEGDDSLGAYLFEPDESILTRLGAKAKLQTFEFYYDASFCGMIFSAESDSIIRDPMPCILDFGYCHYKYAGASNKTLLSLLRSKSLSLLCGYPGCPILKSLALYGLKVTSAISNKIALWKTLKGTHDTYQRSKILGLMDEKFESYASMVVSDSTRFQMSRLFGITVEDQLKIESYLDGLSGLEPLNNPILLSYTKACQQEYFDKYRAWKPQPRVEELKSNRFWSKLQNLY